MKKILFVFLCMSFPAFAQVERFDHVIVSNSIWFHRPGDGYWQLYFDKTDGDLTVRSHRSLGPDLSFEKERVVVHGSVKADKEIRSVAAKTSTDIKMPITFRVGRTGAIDIRSSLLRLWAPYAQTVLTVNNVPKNFVGLETTIYNRGPGTVTIRAGGPIQTEWTGAPGKWLKLLFVEENLAIEQGRHP